MHVRVGAKTKLSLLKFKRFAFSHELYCNRTYASDSNLWYPNYFYFRITRTKTINYGSSRVRSENQLNDFFLLKMFTFLFIPSYSVLI